MSNSDKKSNGGGRSNHITLNTINEKVKTLEGTGRVTPIKMSDLNSRITSIESAKHFEEYSWSGTSRYFTIPEKYREGWNFLVIECYYLPRSGSQRARIHVVRNGVTGISSGAKEVDYRIVRSGNDLFVSGSDDVQGTELTVLWYK